jgi:hypothetical protein
MLVISDRVKESSITEGIGSVVLAGSFGSFQSFSTGIGDGNTTYYCIENGTRWEVGQGSYNQGMNSLSRDLIFDSSVGGATKISLEGPSVVFCTLPADRAIIQNEVGHTFVSGISTLELNASGINSNSINNFGEAAFAEKVLVSGDLALLGQLLYGGNLSNINNITNSGDIVSSGFLTLVRPEGDAGNFFHAYKEDGTRQTVALHFDSQISPLWKFGLKTNPNSQTGPPTFAYVFARDGSAGMVSNTDNFFSISDSIGLNATHNSNTVLRASSITGVYLETTSSANPSFVITGPPLATQPLQEWRQSDDTILSVVDSGGRFGILRENPEYELDVNGDGRMETIYVTSGIYFQDGTFQNTANVTGSGGGSGGGGGNRQYSNVTADYSMSSSDDVIFADSTSNPVNVYIPTAVSVGGKEVTIKMVAGSQPVAVVPSGAELIDNQASYTITNTYESITLLSNNSNWFII